MKQIISLILLSCISSLAFPEDRATANLLMVMCNSKNETNSYICTSYIHGFIDGLMVGSFIDMPRELKVSEMTVKNMFMKYMKEHPEDGDNDQAIVLANIFVKSGKVTLRDKSK